MNDLSDDIPFSGAAIKSEPLPTLRELCESARTHVDLKGLRDLQRQAEKAGLSLDVFYRDLTGGDGAWTAADVGMLMLHYVQKHNEAIAKDRKETTMKREGPDEPPEGGPAKPDKSEPPPDRGEPPDEDEDEDEEPAVAAPRGASRAERLPLKDFTAFSPDHSYIYKPDGASWSATAVNARVLKIEVDTRKGKKKISASTWLDRNDAVEQRTWSPGHPQIIEGMLFDQGGVIHKPGARVFNTYRPPLIARVTDDDISPWHSHLYELWPDDARHIELFFAHRAQRPGDKINHALLLAGAPGIGKDAMIEPLKRAVGPWNFREIHPTALLGQFTDFLEAVVLRISEIKDLGDVSRFEFYEATKTLLAAPPDTLRVNKKHIAAYYVMNVLAAIMTSNYKASGLYLPADDRRHFVAWSNVPEGTYSSDYWTKYFAWLDDYGAAAVAQHLRTLDLSEFKPKAPPPKTPAFWEIVASLRTVEQDDMADVIESLEKPAILTVADWTGPVGADSDQAADLTVGRVLRSSNCCGLR
jgi:hypothetical protein